MAFYDLRIADKNEDMKEAKIFSVLKWVFHCEQSANKSLIELYKQYLTTERTLEYIIMKNIFVRDEIVREDYASKCYQQLVLSEELVNTKSRMKFAIISLLSDQNYHIRVKALKCLRIILRKEISTSTINVKDVYLTSSLGTMEKC